MRFHRLVSVAFLLAACSSNPQQADKPLVEDQPVVEPQFPEQPDPGPVFERNLTPLETAVLEEKSLMAARIHSDGSHSYVSVPYSSGQPIEWWVESETYGLAAYDHTSKTILVRFAGALPKEFKLHVWTVARLNTSQRGPTGYERQVLLVRTDDAQKEPKLADEFRLAAAEWMNRMAYGRTAEPFFVYASNRLRLISGRDTQTFRRNRTNELSELMNLYSGYTSVQETLQYDRALLLRSETQRETVELSALPTVPLAQHPWPEMIKALGKQPVIEPMAKVVPQDMLYVHMHDLRDFVKIVKDLDGWVSPLSQALEGNPGPRHFTERYETQLVVARTGLAESLGHLASDGVALTLGDPFLREGTDVSMVFKVENRQVLLTALQKFENDLKAKRNDATVKEAELDGVKVRILSTPDGYARQHRIELGDLLILSNSPAALKKFIAVHRKKAKSIADGGDFKYMRTLYPFDKAAESGFVFVSDAFVAHAISPQVKIAEARRLQAQADLYAVNYSALLFGLMEGRQPKNTEELVKSGYLMKDELAHKDGTRIAFSPQKGSSSELGTVAFLKPIGEWNIQKVTAAERDAYARFVETYQSYWKRYIDPIAVQVKRSADGNDLSANVRILPLIEESEYDDLLRLVGEQRIKPPQLLNTAVWAFGVGQNASLRREADQMAQQMLGTDKISVGWLGDWVMVGVADRSGVFDMALASGVIPEHQYRNMSMSSDSDLPQVLSRLPIFAAAHIDSPIVLASVLTGMKAYVQQAAPNMIEWSQSDTYREIPIVTIQEGSQAAMGTRFGLKIHYATVGDVFLVAFDRATLDLQINQLLDGKGPGSVAGTSTLPTPDDIQTTMHFNFREMDGLSWGAKTFLGVLESGARDNIDTARSSYFALHYGLGRNLAKADVRRMGLAYLGYEPRDVHGNGFEVSERGRIQSVSYGGPEGITLPPIPSDGPVAAFVERLRSLEFGLGFSGQTPHRGLFGTVTVRTTD